MAPEEDLKKRVGRKLTKKRKEGRQATMEIPERFRDGDDADEDCTALHGRNAYMNQSVFGMIAAAGSQVDFNARFDGQSSDEDEDSGVPPASLTSELQVLKTRKLPVKPEKNHRRKFSESKLLRSLGSLGSKSKKEPKTPERPTTVPSTESIPAKEPPAPRTPTRDAPVMSRMLEARAEMSLRPSFDNPRHGPIREIPETEEQASSSLAKQLMDIFEFEKAEDVIEGMTQLLLSRDKAKIYRIPVLAAEECLTSRLHVYHNKAYMFLRVPTTEICKSRPFITLN